MANDRAAVLKMASAERALPNWLVHNVNFVCLWAAYGISAIGDHLSEMALLQTQGGLKREDITRLQALIQFGFFLPFVLFAPLAGWWADRFSRKWTMIAADILRAGVMASLTVAVPWLAPRVGDFAIVLPLAVTGALAAFFSPARQALLPTLIRDDQLVRANAMISALGTIGTIISAMIGGVLVDLHLAGHLALEWNYWLDALTFLVSAAFLSMISMSRARVVDAPRIRGVLTPLRQGFGYVRQHRRVLQLILLGMVFWAAAGIVVSVVPALVRDLFGGQFKEAGLYRGLLGIGLVLGATAMTIFGPALPLQLAVLAGLTSGCFWITLLDLTYLFAWHKVLAAVCLIGIGTSGAALLVTVMASLQRFVPDARRGRVFGVSDMATMLSLATTTGIIGLAPIPNLDRYVAALLALAAIGMGLSAIYAWRRYRRGSRYRWDVQLTLWLVHLHARFWCRMKRVGHCTIPAEGPVIVAANHGAGIDPLIIVTTSPYRPPGYLVEKKYYETPIAKYFMDMIGCIPVDRENPGRSFFTNCMKRLKEGGVVGIFPQGTFEEPGKPRPPAKAGIGTLALRSGATVIPVHIGGTRYYNNPFASLFSRHHVRITWGAPVDLSSFAGRERDPDAPQQVADRIMDAVYALAPTEASD